jgi:hypothetical protein
VHSCAVFQNREYWASTSSTPPTFQPNVCAVVVVIWKIIAAESHDVLLRATAWLLKHANGVPATTAQAAFAPSVASQAVNTIVLTAARLAALGSQAQSSSVNQSAA